MRILVYGAGVMGSLYAAWLQEAGHEVTLVARGERRKDLEKHGILLENMATYQFTITKVAVIEQVEADAAYDLAIVVLRKNQVSSVLPVLAEARNIPDVLFLGNNAAGPDEYVDALGAERVLMGFGNAAGYLEGKVVHYICGRGTGKAAITLGELDGQMTPRLQRIGDAFESAGFEVAFSDNIDAWLKTHAAIISPIANALYLAGGDNYRLANTRDGLLLAVCAIREGFKVLRALDVPVTPASLRALEWVPEPVLVAWAKRLFDSKWARIAVARHVNDARDEMKQLADEFWALARATAVPTPAIDRLYQYVDPNTPTVPEGSAAIPLDYRGVWAAITLAAGVIVGGMMLRRRMTRRRQLTAGEQERHRHRGGDA